MTQEERYRLFIAVKIAEDLGKNLVEVQKQLQKIVSEVKWTREDQFHITLKFLGEVPSSRVQEIAEQLLRVGQKTQPFEIELKGAGAFPNPFKPRVLWVGLERGEEEMTHLAQAVDQALQTLGFAPEDRPFKAHLTLGRPRVVKENLKLAQALQNLEALPLGRMRVNTLILYRSILKPEGPEYTPLVKVSLGST